MNADDSNIHTTIENKYNGAHDRKVSIISYTVQYNIIDYGPKTQWTTSTSAISGLEFSVEIQHVKNSERGRARSLGEMINNESR